MKIRFIGGPKDGCKETFVDPPSVMKYRKCTYRLYGDSYIFQGWK